MGCSASTGGRGGGTGGAEPMDSGVTSPCDSPMSMSGYNYVSGRRFPMDLQESGLRVVEVTPEGGLLLLRLAEEARYPHPFAVGKRPFEAGGEVEQRKVPDTLLLREAYLSSYPSLKVGETQLLAAGEPADKPPEDEFDIWGSEGLPVSPRGCEDITAGVTCIIPCDQKLPSFILGQKLLLGSPVKPFGLFESTLDTDRVIILCAESGVSRVYPWLRKAILCPNEHPLPALKITLYYQVGKRQSIAFAREFDTWEADQYTEGPPPHPHLFTANYVLTTPDDDWGGLMGDIATCPDSTLAGLALDNATVYVSGPAAFVDGVSTGVLQRAQIPAHRVHICVT